MEITADRMLTTCDLSPGVEPKIYGFFSTVAVGGADVQTRVRIKNVENGLSDKPCDQYLINLEPTGVIE